MPSKKKKYNARFPAGRIKKIMQSDEEIGKVAQAVPVIISRTLELFVESLLNKTVKITNSRNAKTLSTSHMKQCIMSEQRFDFLRELVKNIPDISVAEEAANEEEGQSSPEEAQYPDSDTPYDLSLPSTSTRASAINNQLTITPVTMVQPANGGGGDHYQNGSARAHLKRSSSMTRSHNNSIHETQVEPATVGITLATLSPRLQRLAGTLRSNSSNSDSDHSAAKRSAVEQHTPQPHTAIPVAPIVSFDFFNKPVVKIDYSNLPVTGSNDAPLPPPTSTAAPPPHSAPADLAGVPGSGAQSAFDFNAAPIISIDLSNIVTDSSGHTTCNVSNPVATISIGALPSSMSTAPPISEKMTSHPASTMPTSTKSITAKHSMEMTASAAQKSSLFELDEDYDNI